MCVCAYYIYMYVYVHNIYIYIYLFILYIYTSLSLSLCVCMMWWTHKLNAIKPRPIYPMAHHFTDVQKFRPQTIKKMGSKKASLAMTC